MEPAIDDGVKSRFLTLSATHCPSQASAFATQKKTCIPESKLTYTRQYFYSALLNTSLSTAPFWQATMVVQTASPVILTAVLAISRIRSIPMIIPIASTGRPTELNTIVKVTSPTLGIPAVPMEASVAVPITVI